MLTAAVTVPGDYNADGIVDGADYVAWRDRLGSNVPLPNDDTPGVDASDYQRWRQNFGQSASGEPFRPSLRYRNRRPYSC